MSRRGVWQLTKLTLNYCAHSGSSRGARCVSCGRDMAPLSLPAQRLHSRGAWGHAQQQPAAGVGGCAEAGKTSTRTGGVWCVDPLP